MKGKVFKFGDDISTDHITPGRYFHLRGDMTKLAEHTLEDADPSFAQKVQPGDFVVGGCNFGLGSSREHAPLVIKECKVSAVLARSFARIFYRNSINVGLPVLECDTDGIDAGDELEVDLAQGVIRNLTKGEEINFTPIPEFMRGLLADGGLAAHIKKHGGFKL
ncbi:3-isopropylmalate dehydratase [bacterium]|nr:3-isopropylmalate dehydratase [bacterium]